MCGIGGILLRVASATPATRDDLGRMAASLHHRGPDERGRFRDDRVGLCHTRLSIVDLDHGRQPLQIDDGRWVIVYNGEVFNHVELRAELERDGAAFATRSDTEVVLRAWQRWGPDALSRFNGQFAFAIYDRASGDLVLARDPVGIRPLYYREAEGRVIFGSEVKAVFAGAPHLPRAFDPVGLDQVLTFWATVAPRTVFADVAQVRPGHYRHYRGDEVSEHRYFDLDFTPRFTGTDAEANEATAAALGKATRLRMLRADVPVGSYLSGGLDSSLVAALASRAVEGAQFETFSLRFADAEYDETPYQRLMTERLGTRHHEIVVERSDIAATLPDVVRFTESPILRTAPAPLLLLSRLVREHGIKVVLTGEGADEMFAGYDIFREGVVRRFWARQPDSTCRPRLIERLYPYLARSPVRQRAMAQRFFGRDLHQWEAPGFTHGLRWQTTSALKRMLVPDLKRDGAIEALVGELPGSFSGWSHLARDQHLEITTLLSGYLLSSQGDRMLMGSSVEGRFPFLDPEVMALAASFPDRQKLRALDEKRVLKQVGRELVPNEILTRKKQPYRAPDALAFVGDHVPSWTEEVLSEEAVTRAGVFVPRAASQLWKKCQQRAAEGQFSNTDNMALIALLSTQLLHRDLIQAAPPAPVIDWTVDVGS